MSDATPVRATRGLLEALLELAEESAPEAVSVALGASSGEAFDAGAVPEDATVLTHFYFPDAGAANRAVFGVDLSVSPGRTAGRFLSHPDGDPALSSRDELHAAVLVAVPPWRVANVFAYDRSGRDRPLTVVDASPPDEHLPGEE